MAGNLRFESSSASPEELGFSGGYANGQRGNYLSATLDRSGSFREGSDSRLYSSGASTPRSSASSLGDGAPLSQCLLLDPITIGDQKYTRSDELRRLLGTSLGSSSEENSFGAAHSRPSLPVAAEDLKRFKASVQDTTCKARFRIKRLNASLMKLNKYCEMLNLKKQQRNEMLVNEKSGGSHFTKMGIQIHRNHSDIGPQRLEDRTKNIVLNKRVRSSVAERADGRGNILPRQVLVVAKDKDVLRDGEGSDLAEEKIRRLPAGGEGWDKKMKRKRSVGTVFTRPMESEGDVKRVMHNKFNSEPGQQSYDAQGCRSGPFNGTSGINKLEGASLPATSNARAAPKIEGEKVSLMRDSLAGLNKERLIVKPNKLNILEDNHIVSPSPVTKGKASRAPRTGSVMAANSSPNFTRTPAPLDGWEQPPSINKVNTVGVANNRKRPPPTGSSSPPMAQWVGQRPQKISRTRRANVVSPVSNHDEVPVALETDHSSDFSARGTSAVINGSILSKDVANGTQQVRVKHENVPSPARLSESEDSVAGETREGRPKEKGIGSGGVEDRLLNQNVGPVFLSKKKKVVNQEDIGDGVRRQGRSGRSAASSRPSISPLGEKLEHTASTKPIRSTRTVSDKNGSKSGRPPLKKASDRKGFKRLGQTPTSSSPDFTGESDDDHEELLAAANYACNASYLSCSSSFWKKMEPVFASLSMEDSTYLMQQLRSSVELHEIMSQMFGHGSGDLDNLMGEEDIQSQLVSEESGKSLQGQVWDDGSLCRNPERSKVTPLYQRVLSALIAEDVYGESEEIGERDTSLEYDRNISPDDNCPASDIQRGNKEGSEFEYDVISGLQTCKESSIDDFCNGRTTINKGTGVHNQLCNDNLLQGGHEFMHSKIGMFSRDSINNDGKLPQHTNTSSIAALDGQYEEMCLNEKLLLELNAIGLCPENVPNLADGDDEAIGQNMFELQKECHQQVGKKKSILSKISKEIEKVKEKETWSLEQVAMNRLVELAYRKLLATRGSSASKLGVPKVPKQVAMGFMKRTLARCRKFADTGNSCFSEPVLRDIIFAAPLRGADGDSMNCLGLAVATNKHSGTPNSQQDMAVSGPEQHDLLSDKFLRGPSNALGVITHSSDQDFAKTGPILNRGKKKEVLLDDVGGKTSVRVTPSLGSTMLGGAKGKRSDRERDKDVVGRGPVAKAGRLSQSSSQSSAKGDRKTKSKPKQKTAQVSTSGDGNMNKWKETGINNKREVGVTSQGQNPQDLSKESKETTEVADLQELESIDDLTNFLNLDGLPENDFAAMDGLDGLEIPMDDLSELNMLL